MQSDGVQESDVWRVSRPRAFRGGLEVVTAPSRFRRYPLRVGAGFELCVSRNASPPRNQVNGHSFDVPDGTLLVVQPGTVWRAEGADSFRSLEISPETLTSWGTQVTGLVFHAPSYEPRHVAGLATWFERAHAALEDETDALAAGELVATILGTVVARCTSAVARSLRAGPPAALERVRELLLLESARQLSLEDIVDEAAVEVGPFHLLRTFKRRFGVTPHQYQRLARLAHALSLLRGGMPPAEAALTAGFTISRI